MVYIYSYIWLIFMVHVGKYTIHGSYGYIYIYRYWLLPISLEFPPWQSVKVQNPTGSQPVPLKAWGRGYLWFFGDFYGVGLQVTIPFHTEITQGIQKNQCQGTIYLVLLMEAEILHQVLRSKVLKNLRWLFGISEASKTLRILVVLKIAQK